MAADIQCLDCAGREVRTNPVPTFGFLISAPDCRSALEVIESTTETVGRGVHTFYRLGTGGAPVFVEVPAPSDEALQAGLHKMVVVRYLARVAAMAGQSRH